MEDHHVRSLFIFFLIFLPLQYALVGIIGSMKSEPWPAFVFPGFKNVYVYDSGYELPDVVIEVFPESKGESIKLSPQQFFPDVAPSQILGFMRTHFSEQERIDSFSDEARNWLFHHATAAVTDPPVAVEVVWLKNYYAKPEVQAIPDSTVEVHRFDLLNGREL